VPKKEEKREKERERKAAWFGVVRSTDIPLVDGLGRGKERHFWRINGSIKGQMTKALSTD